MSLKTFPIEEGLNKFKETVNQALGRPLEPSDITVVSAAKLAELENEQKDTVVNTVTVGKRKNAP